MLHWNEIELWEDPRLDILSKITKVEKEPEMSPFESAYLCGWIKRIKPKKILEIGIAGGGTTAILLQAMSDLFPRGGWKVFSIDYSKNFYRDMTKVSGFLGCEAKNILNGAAEICHEFLLGDIACNYIEKTGANIDLIIIDTMHILPGETLDFLTLLPYMKNGGVVILHDISMHQYDNCSRETFATGALFSAVTAEKYLNKDDKRAYPNIGAFVVNEETRNHIEDVFLTLILPWSYFPENRQIESYRKAVERNYDKQLLSLFDTSIVLNKNKLKQFSFSSLIPYHKIRRGSKIILYGAGKVGRLLKEQIDFGQYCEVVAWVDKNKGREGTGILPVNAISNTNYECVLIAVMDRSTAIDIYFDLALLGIDRKRIEWILDF